MQLYIPIIAAVLSALSAIGTMILKDIVYQNKKDSKSLLKERLEKCYTPVFLTLKNRNKDHMNDPNEFLNDIEPYITLQGHLLSAHTLDKYIELILNAKEYNHYNLVYENEKSSSDEDTRHKAIDSMMETKLNMQSEYRNKYSDFTRHFDEEYMSLKNSYLK